MKSEVSVNFERFSQAAENNKSAILEQLSNWLDKSRAYRVLEIGSGSGQHAVHFASSLPHVTWQPSDRGDYYSALQTSLASIELPNLAAPAYFDALDARVSGDFDAAYCANVFHIMAADLIPHLMREVSQRITSGGYFFVYGPYRYEGEFTTESNAQFDEWLKARDPLSGIRDIEMVSQIASEHHLSLITDVPMPSNNQFLVFEKETV